MIINHSCHQSPWNLIKYFIFRRNNLAAMNTTVKRKTLEDCDDNNGDDVDTEIVPKEATSEIQPKIDNHQQRPVSKKSRTAKIDLPKESLDVSNYYIENGNRKVYPYYYTYHSYCKGRWLGKTLGDLFADEFRRLTPEILTKKIEKGLLKVNGQPVSLDYQLKDNDFITHRIHRHEFPVLAAPIPIIHSDEQLLVIDKPPSLPVHACGKFRLNSIISVLEKENKIQDLHLLHRLDRLTSGIMIIARTKACAQKLHEQMRNREMHKEYLCRVDGYFPDGTIECDQPIETLDHKIGICIVSTNGKPSRTKFERLNYNGKSSTVRAQPLTGRMHQIRVHLQYLGYPIVNDNFYNNTVVFGRKKGCQGDMDGKTKEQILQDLESEHSKSIYYVDNDDNQSEDQNQQQQKQDRINDERNLYALKALEHYTSQPIWNDLKTNYQFDAEKYVKDPDCNECRNEMIDPVAYEQLIYLHALKYQGKDWSFETQIPVWAKDTWTYD